MSQWIRSANNGDSRDSYINLDHVRELTVVVAGVGGYAIVIDEFNSTTPEDTIYGIYGTLAEANTALKNLVQRYDASGLE